MLHTVLINKADCSFLKGQTALLSAGFWEEGLCQGLMFVKERGIVWICGLLCPGVWFEKDKYLLAFIFLIEYIMKSWLSYLEFGLYVPFSLCFYKLVFASVTVRKIHEV